MPAGRPTIYTEELAGEICTHIAGGKSLRSFCAQEGKPASGGHAIYALCDPESGDVRYIGKTNNPNRRLGQHCRPTYSNGGTIPRRRRWLDSLKKRGLDPEMVVIEWVDDWDSAERYWVSLFRELGFDLVNGTDGGKDYRHLHAALVRGEWCGRWTPIQRVRQDIRSIARGLEKAGYPDRAAAQWRNLEIVNECVNDICERLGKKLGTEWMNRMMAMNRPGLFGRPQ